MCLLKAGGFICPLWILQNAWHFSNEGVGLVSLVKISPLYIVAEHPMDRFSASVPLSISAKQALLTYSCVSVVLCVWSL